MKESCKRALRDYMTSRFAQARKNSGLTQARFSEKLMMDTRSYVALEHGDSLCCTLTFMLYLCFLCEDVDGLVDDLRNIILTAQKQEKYPQEQSAS